MLQVPKGHRIGRYGYLMNLKQSHVINVEVWLVLEAM